jgi:hypothetical protein
MHELSCHIKTSISEGNALRSFIICGADRIGKNIVAGFTDACVSVDGFTSICPKEIVSSVARNAAIFVLRGIHIQRPPVHNEQSRQQTTLHDEHTSLRHGSSATADRKITQHTPRGRR